MAFTFRGIGTMHYGKREFRADGSFVTTLWFVFLYIPVIPLKSFRLLPTGTSKYYGLRRSQVVQLIEKTKPNRSQVLSVYAWFAVEVAILVTARLQDSWWIAAPGILLLGLPWWLRRRAVDRVKAESLRQQMGFSPSLRE